MLPDLGNYVAELQLHDPAPLVGDGQVCAPPVEVDGRWDVTIICINGFGSAYMGTITGVTSSVANAITDRYRREGPFLVAFAVDASKETYTSKRTGESYRLLEGKVGHGTDCDHRIGPRIAMNI